MFINKDNILTADIDEIPIDSSWTIGDKKASLMHNIHAYPAKFPSFITTKALQYAENKGIRVDTIADLFCGCGTVAYEAMVNNRNFFGIDINPIATLIAKTKCRKYDKSIIIRYLKLIKEKFDIAENNFCNKFSENERIVYWFEEQQRTDLFKLLTAINSIVNIEEYKNFFYCAYSAILKSCSRWLTKSIKPQIDPNKKAKDVWRAFETHVKMMIKANEQCNINNDLNIDISTQSVLDLSITYPFVDMLITSPPYVTSYEYADLHQLSTLCLGYSPDYKYFRKGSIGSLYNPQSIEENLNLINEIGSSVVKQMIPVDKRRARSIAQYYIDIQKVVNKIRCLLRDRGVCFFVIGNTEYKGVKIDNARHLAQCLLDENFHDIEIKRRKISNKILTPYRDKSGKFSSDKSCRKIYSEEFLIFAQK